MVRLCFGNVNGIPPKWISNNKVNAIRRWIRKHDADGFFGVEANLNWTKMPMEGKLPELFRTENAIRTITAHNTHENFGRRQQGGTFGMVFGQLAGTIIDVGTDAWDLGRWCWMLAKGRDGHKVRIVVAYQPCISKLSQLGTVHSQHRRYLDHEGRRSETPRAAFRHDLLTSLRAWRENGERLILFMDANEDTTKGPLNAALTGPGLLMREGVRSLHPNLPATPTFKAAGRMGRAPIDAVYLTPDLPAEAGSWLAVKRCPGDHRFCIIDIRWKALVGEDLFNIKRPQARRLACSVPSAVRKYNTELEGSLKKHKVLSKLHALYTKTGSQPLTTSQQQEMIEIDKTKEELMRHAEKKCRRFCFGEIDFSPDVNKARGIRMVWDMVLKRRAGKRNIKTRKIKAIAKAVGVVNPLGASDYEANRAFHLADEKYRKLKPNAPTIRSDWLKERSYDSKLSEADRKRARVALRHERVRDNNRRMRHVLGRKRAGAVIRIGVGEGAEYIELSEKEVVEMKIMENNTKRFRLTENTPPMQEPLLSDLGYLGDTPEAEMIMDGTYVCPPGVDEYTQDFFQCLRRPEWIAPGSQIRTTFTKEDFQAYWKAVSEWISSSISGLHFGHYKAVIKNDYISEIHAVFTDIAVNAGFSLPRWQRGLTVMLEKKAGLILVVKLRAILLMEADFNYANKEIFGRRMMWFAEDHNMLPDEAYGSRKNREAIDLALNRRLMTDYCRQMRISAAIAAADLADCYDRIAHSTASLGCQRMGVPVNVIRYMLLTIQLMTFFLRTGHGDSTTSYGGAYNACGVPFQGICQGNGGGPATFQGTCTPAVDLLHKRGFASRFIGALSATTFVIIGFIYVDDMDLAQVARHRHESIDIVIERMQQMILCWEAGLALTGGSLGPAKCSWGPIAFCWDREGQWHYRTDIQTEIFISDDNGESTPIARLAPSEAIEVVGVWQAIDGNMKQQVAVMKKKATDLGEMIQKGYLPRNLVWQSFRTMIWPSLRYPLAATTITEEESTEITASLYKHFLPSAGTNRNFPKAVRHAPLDFFGLDLNRCIDYQGIEQIKKLLTHGAVDTPTGKLMRDSLELAQLEVGMGIPILEADFEMYGHLLTDCWIKVLWRFISPHNIHLRNPEQVLPTLQRVGDAFIMEKVTQSEAFSEEEEIRINRCRIYFQAMTLADIVTGDGSKITPQALALDRALRPESRYMWPNELPSRADRNLWKRALRRITSETWTLSFFDRLGHWTTEPHLQWQWFHLPRPKTLFRCVEGVWSKCEPISSRASVRYSRAMIPVEEQDVPMANLQLATISIDNRGYRIFGGAAPSSIPPTAIPSSIRELIDTWEDGWPLRDSFFPTDPSLLIAALKNGTATLVADGSFKPKKSTKIGAAGWIIECLATGAICRGRVQTSGIPREVNAYRSELQGIHTGLLGVSALCEYGKLSSGKILIGCDCEKGVDLAASTVPNISLQRKHVDLIRAIRRICASLPIDVQFFHLEGHQDDHKSVSLLDRPSQLNVMMDDTAKTLVDRLAAQPYSAAPSSIRGEGWSCWVGDVKMTTDPTDEIKRAVHEQVMKTHLSRPDHLRLSQTGFDFADWYAVRCALQKFPELFRMWASKHMAHFCGVGRMMRRWGFWDHDRCPCCKEPDETTLHLLTCEHPILTQNFHSRVKLVDIWMQQNDTHPDIRICFRQALETRDPEATFSSFSSPFCHEAALEQDEIGWQNFAEGKISKRWRLLQEEYFQEIDSSRSADRWAEGMVSQLLELTHSQWKVRSEHLHERNHQGLLHDQAVALEQSINEEFARGYENLARRDRHLIQRGRDSVISLSGSDKQAWLRSVQIARSSQQTAPSGIAAQRAFMESFFMAADT